MTENLQQDQKFIQDVFNKVYSKYDLMNDLMSFGIHRNWKKQLITTMNPGKDQSLIDVGCGTGDIGKLFSLATNYKSKILSVDPNSKMIDEGKKRLKKFKNIEWKVCAAENLSVKDQTFDFYTISFGLRNTSNKKKAIAEAYRVLKNGGRFLCLEFSKIENPSLEYIYKKYSNLIPIFGKFVVGEKEPYEYLVKSIDKFMNQNELLDMLKVEGFVNSNYINLSGGIVAIHSGWKI